MFGVVMALEVIVLKNKYKKTLLIVILKKIILIWISAYNINKQQVFEKWVILIFIKPRFETQIYMESSIKKHKIFY